jgi:type I restriction enzyme, S subunit
VSAEWRSIRLDELLTRSDDTIAVLPDASYREITVKLWGKGVVPRGTVIGAEIAAQRRFVARSGHLILSRIDARNGAIGIVPPELDGALVSGDFPLFEIDRERIEPAFFDWLSKTRAFVDLCRRASEGTTNRVRLQEEKFLAFEILIPGVREQRRIVTRIDELSEKVAQVRAFRESINTQTQALLAAFRNRVIGSDVGIDWIPLDAYVARIESGKSPATEGRRATEDEWAVLKVGAVSFGVFDERENKALPASFTPLPAFEVRAGDFLLSRANTSDLVGACAVVSRTRPKLMLSDKIFRFVFREPRRVDLFYLDKVLKSPALREQIVRCATGTSPTMKNISKEKVLALRIPPHSLTEQRRLAEHLTRVESRVCFLKRTQTEAFAELDALLPAIVDRVFKGEL